MCGHSVIEHTLARLSVRPPLATNLQPLTTDERSVLLERGALVPQRVHLTRQLRDLVAFLLHSERERLVLKRNRVL